MSTGNYIQGSTDTTNNAYNLLISGAPSGYTSSGINIGGDTATTYGVKLTSDSTHNAFMDVRGDASNKIAFRHKDQTSGTISSMLDLANDSALTGSGYGATVNGRVNASSYYVGSVDTRAPTSTGVYMGTDGNVGYFNINKGSGTGGFAFNTYNADGTLLQSNLNLKASGVIQASYYTATGNADDSESVAVIGFDASGNIVRHYQSNARFRTIEARLTAAESSVNGPVSSKVNEVISRLNGLNFFSQNIQTLPTAPAAPTNVVPTQASTTSMSVAFTGDNQATSYTVTSTPGGITATGSSSPIMLSGLTTGTAYTVTVTATNSVGSATSSASASITLSAPAAGWYPATYTCGSANCTFSESSLVFGQSVNGVAGAKAVVESSGGTVNAFTLYFGSWGNFFLIGSDKNAGTYSQSAGEPYYLG
jgi:hypothetical protein